MQSKCSSVCVKMSFDWLHISLHPPCWISQGHGNKWAAVNDVISLTKRMREGKTKNSQIHLCSLYKGCFFLRNYFLNLLIHWTMSSGLWTILSCRCLVKSELSSWKKGRYTSDNNKTQFEIQIHSNWTQCQYWREFGGYG